MDVQGFCNVKQKDNSLYSTGNIQHYTARDWCTLIRWLLAKNFPQKQVVMNFYRAKSPTIFVGKISVVLNSFLFILSQ